MGKRSATVEIRRDNHKTVRECIEGNKRALRSCIIGLSNVRKQELKKAKDSRNQRRISKKASKNGHVENIQESIGDKGTSSGEPTQFDESTWASYERTGHIVSPPYDPLVLAVMPENNTELVPAIDAMAVNIESFGWRLEPRIPISDKTPTSVLRKLSEEKTIAENFFENACEDETLEAFREKVRKDLESTGNAYVEFVENPGTKQLDGLNHLPSWTMRIGCLDDAKTLYIDKQIKKNVRFVEMQDDDERILKSEEQINYQVNEVIKHKRFRRYVQIVENKTCFFKELGDPRVISSIDGHVVTREEFLLKDIMSEDTNRFTIDANNKLIINFGKIGFPVVHAANPVKHLKIYSPRSPYGLPRYAGHLFCIYGSRASEEINYTTFKNMNIPSMLITVSNGKLDDESVERLEEFTESVIQSDMNYSQFLLIEAEPVVEGMRDPGSVKIECKPLTQEQHTDALFTNYQKNNNDTVRRAWRFPPIYVGLSEDYTGKTIESSRKLADEQVFQPERNKIDGGFFTKDILIRYFDIVWSVFKSKSPNVTENQDLVKLINMAEKTGGLTPRIARKVMSQVVNEDLGQIDPSLFDPDKPFTLTLAEIMKSNSAQEATGGGEETSQGRNGLQSGGGDRDKSTEPAFDDEEEATEKFRRLLREEVKRRLGGFCPPTFKEDTELDAN